MKIKIIILTLTASFFAICAHAQCFSIQSFVCHSGTAGDQFTCQDGTIIYHNASTTATLNTAAPVPSGGSGFSGQTNINATCVFYFKSQNCVDGSWYNDSTQSFPVPVTTTAGTPCGGGQAINEIKTVRPYIVYADISIPASIHSD